MLVLTLHREHAAAHNDVDVPGALLTPLGDESAIETREAKRVAEIIGHPAKHHQRGEKTGRRGDASEHKANHGQRENGDKVADFHRSRHALHVKAKALPRQNDLHRALQNVEPWKPRPSR